MAEDEAAAGDDVPLPIGIDITIEAGDWPDAASLTRLLRRAVAATLAETGAAGPSELSIVLSDDAHMRMLNAGWRGKDKPTNVLSFPAFPPSRGSVMPPMLGDIVLAWETIRREAELESKPIEHHISHLIVHGLLHLLEHDHVTDTDAEAMEAIERRTLARLAIADPYA